MSLRRSPTAVATLATPLIRLFASTWRPQRIFPERFDDFVTARQGFACMLWHEALLPLLWFHRRVGAVIVVSQNRDGQYLSDFAAAIGYRLVRGSSSRGAVGALLAASRALEDRAVVALTPDGPRGPRRDLKPGVLAAAQRAGAPVVPVHAEADRAWRLDSWDRFCIPKPFARVRIAYGEPLWIPHGAGHLAAAVERARAAMDEVERMAQWPNAAATRTA